MTGIRPGKVAIVTGAGRAVGAAIAKRLAEEGAKLFISDHPSDSDGGIDATLAGTTEAIRSAGGSAEAVVCDLSRREDRHDLVGRASEATGTVDILVNNAAARLAMPIDRFPEERFKHMVEVRLWAPYELAMMVIPGMRAQGSGWILNISDRTAAHPVDPTAPRPPEAYLSVHGMLMAGLNRLTTAMAAELYCDGIAVNCLCPLDGEDATGGTADGRDLLTEAAIALCCEPPASLTGRVAYAQPLLAELSCRTLVP
jgi:citronellol/citronellal dehydrogenase